MDLTNNIINGAFALLDYTNGFDTSIRSLFDDLESLAGYILLEMGVKPFLSSVGEDSMWLLLICDLSIYQLSSSSRYSDPDESRNIQYIQTLQLLVLPLFQEIMLPVGNSVVSRTGINGDTISSFLLVPADDRSLGCSECHPLAKRRGQIAPQKSSFNSAFLSRKLPVRNFRISVAVREEHGLVCWK
nr:hypothetical protein TEA_020727 [Ipomoea trifida]